MVTSMNNDITETLVMSELEKSFNTAIDDFNNILDKISSPSDVKYPHYVIALRKILESLVTHFKKIYGGNAKELTNLYLSTIKLLYNYIATEKKIYE